MFQTLLSNSLGILDPILTFHVFEDELFFVLFSFGLQIHLIKFFPFFLKVDVIVFIGLADFILTNEFKQDSVVGFDCLSDTEAMAVQAGHSEQFEEHVDD